MRWHVLATGAVLTVSLMGCDKIPFLSKKTETAATDTTKVAMTPADTQPVDTAAQPALKQTPRPARTAQGTPATTARRPLVDEPWTPVDTGTVAPGMTREQVIALWGVPVTERHAGNQDFLYFRNGCEVTCGTFDVVFLEDDQVVDAIVRGQGHNYAGVSSSPADRKPEFTPPTKPGGDNGTAQ